MINAITIRGLGPHVETTLAIPAGWVQITGESRAGKSELVEALTFATWGKDPRGGAFPTEAIHREAEAAEVEITWLHGVRTGRKMTPSRYTTRWLEREGHDQIRFSTDADALRGIGPFGTHADLARLVVVPMSWIPLAEGSGGGRPLRDVLVSLLPSPDVGGSVARLMALAGVAMREDDPTTEAGAVKARADANAEVKRIEGGARKLARVIADAEEANQRAAGPSDDDVAVARQVLDAHEMWQRYDRAAKAHAAAVEDHRRRVAATHHARPPDRVDAHAQQIATREHHDPIRRHRPRHLPTFPRFPHCFDGGYPKLFVLRRGIGEHMAQIHEIDPTTPFHGAELHLFAIENTQDIRWAAEDIGVEYRALYNAFRRRGLLPWLKVHVNQQNNI